MADAHGGGFQELSRILFLQALAGSGARCASSALLIPVDTVKVRMQNQGNLDEGAVKRYRGVTHAFQSIFKEEGMKGFYKGLPARLMYVGPTAAVSFAVYEQIKRALYTGEKSEYMAAVAPVALGVAFKLFTAAARTPFDTVKQRLEIQGSIRNAAGGYDSTLSAFRDIYAVEGIRRGFFSGYIMTVLRDIPFGAIYFVSYEWTRGWQKTVMASMGKETGLVNFLIAGGMAGVTATVFTYPVDLVKTRLQVQGESARSGKVGRKYTGIPHAVATIFKEEGPRAFFRGLSARILSILPSSAITFGIYEQLKKLMNIDRYSKHRYGD